jgi:hypothetical protein
MSTIEFEQPLLSAESGGKVAVGEVELEAGLDIEQPWPTLEGESTAYNFTTRCPSTIEVSNLISGPSVSFEEPCSQASRDILGGWSVSVKSRRTFRESSCAAEKESDISGWLMFARGKGGFGG